MARLASSLCRRIDIAKSQSAPLNSTLATWPSGAAAAVRQCGKGSRVALAVAKLRSGMPSTDVMLVDGAVPHWSRENIMQQSINAS